jgi:chromosome segregation ATPase
MVDEEEYKRLKEEVNRLRKNKIIVQAKLKQKEDKITELTNKLRKFSIKKTETRDAEKLNEKIELLKDKLSRSRGLNKKLRAEKNSLAGQLSEAKENVSSQKRSTPKVQRVESHGAGSGPGEEELTRLKSQIMKKDERIRSLNQELDNMAGGGGGMSYSKIRKLNAKIRELKSQLEMSKKSEEQMKQRLYEMNRKMAAQDFEDSW